LKFKRIQRHAFWFILREFADPIGCLALEAHNHAVHVSCGCMEEPHEVRTVALLRAREFHFTWMDISLFVGKEKVVAKHGSPWLLAPFIMMHRMMQGATAYFKIPYDHAIEIGGNIEI